MVTNNYTQEIAHGNVAITMEYQSDNIDVRIGNEGITISVETEDGHWIGQTFTDWSDIIEHLFYDGED